jgi:hypothetical protein
LSAASSVCRSTNQIITIGEQQVGRIIRIESIDITLVGASDRFPTLQVDENSMS